MKNTYFLSSAIFLFFTQLTFSQQSEENFAFKNYNSSIFEQHDSALNFLNSSRNSNNNKESFTKIKNSGVAIQQIGNFNVTLLDINSKKVSISVNQEGNNNEYNLVKDGRSIMAEISQKGNRNTINDYSYKTNYETNTSMIQNGNDQNIKSIGTNSISKDMKVMQTGTGASVIILNKLN